MWLQVEHDAFESDRIQDFNDKVNKHLNRNTVSPLITRSAEKVQGDDYDDVNAYLCFIERKVGHVYSTAL